MLILQSPKQSDPFPFSCGTFAQKAGEAPGEYLADDLVVSLWHALGCYSPRLNAADIFSLEQCVSLNLLVR